MQENSELQKAPDTVSKRKPQKPQKPQRTVFRTTFPLGLVSEKRWALAFALSLVLYVVMVEGDTLLAALGVDMARIAPFFMGIVFVAGYALPLVLGGLRGYRDLLGTFRPKDILLVLGYAFAMMVLAFWLTTFVDNLQENESFELLKVDNGVFVLLLLLVVQLFIEEILAIIPFLTVYHAVEKQFKNSVVATVAALAVSIFFACTAHLSTYNFNLGQAFLVIGAARLVLGICYVHTKSLLVCYATHLLYDVVLVALAVTALSQGF